MLLIPVLLLSHGSNFGAVSLDRSFEIGQPLLNGSKPNSSLMLVFLQDSRDSVDVLGKVLGGT